MLNNEWLPQHVNAAFSFERYSASGQALLAKMRTDYTATEVEFRELAIFNGRYSGVEALEKAFAAYREAFEDDDIAEMLRQRLALPPLLDQARVRKQLLTQQSAKLSHFDKRLADFAAAIHGEGLTRFLDQQNQTVLLELRNELAVLSQTPPNKRGDIAPKLELLATQITPIDAAIRLARSVKNQAEQTHQMLVDTEHAARRILESARSEKLKEAFDKELINSVDGLIIRSHELASSELWLLSERRADIAAAIRELDKLQNAIQKARDLKKSAELQRCEQLTDLKSYFIVNCVV